MAYVFQTNLLAPDAAFSVPQQAIADEDALDLVLSIADTHTGGTAAAADADVGARVSDSKWQLNQIRKNIRVAFEDKEPALNALTGLVACDYDQSNTKLNVQRWILDMCGTSSVDVVLGKPRAPPRRTWTATPKPPRVTGRTEASMALRRTLLQTIAKSKLAASMTSSTRSRRRSPSHG